MESLLWLMAMLLAFAPGVVMLWYIRRLDKYEPEPWNLIALAFFAGCLSVIPAVIIEGMLGMKLGGFLGTVWSAFVVAGLTEEVCKGGLGFVFMWRKPQFNEVMDGIVYFGVAHMGFAITENLFYVLVQPKGNVVAALMTAFARTTTAVPLHVINGMIMGYHLGVARFSQKPAERRSHFFQALLWPVLLHGVYDVAAFNEAARDIKSVTDVLRAGFGTALLYAAVVALWLFLLPRIRKAQEASPFRPREWPTIPVATTACGSCGSGYPMAANYCHMCGAPVAQQAPYYQEAPGGAQ